MIDILEFMIELKHEYQKQFKDDCLDVNTMIKKLNYQMYNDFELCVNIIQHNEFVLLSYSLIKGGEIDIATNPNSIYRNCRGTVIDMKKEKLVLLPFRKFFNVGETDECSLPIVLDKLKKAKLIEVTNKLDGSMIAMRYYNDDVFVGSTGSLTEDKNPRLPWSKRFLTDGHKQMLMDNQDYTFMFELLLFNLPQMVEYSESQDGIYLIGARNVNTGEQLTYHQLSDLANRYNIPMVEIENYSFDELMKMRTKFEYSQKEGWVIRIDDTLYKLKCEDYLNMNKLLGTSPNIILQAWVAGVLDDEKPRMNKHMIEYVGMFERQFQKYAKMKREEINNYYRQFADIKTDKELGLAVQKAINEGSLPKKYKGFMFNLYKGRENNIFKNLRYNKLVEYIGEPEYAVY